MWRPTQFRHLLRDIAFGLTAACAGVAVAASTLGSASSACVPNVDSGATCEAHEPSGQAAKALLAPAQFGLPGEPFAIRSVSFPIIGRTYLDDVDGWTPIPEAIAQMKALGVNDVRVTVPVAGYLRGTDNLPDPAYSASLRPSDDKLLALFRAIKAAGLQLTVLPNPNVIFNPNGDLLDGIYVRPTDFRAWMEGYTPYFISMARLAQQAGAERILMFSDFEQATTQDPANTAAWLGLIRATRQVFSGALTSMVYASGLLFPGGNSHVDLIASDILAALDIIGIGWFPIPLTNGVNDPSMAQLLAA